MTARKWLIVTAIALAVAAFFFFDLGRFLTLENLQASRARIVAQVDAAPVLSSLVFFGAYVIMAALSLPGAAIMTLAAGAVFGTWWGVVLVSFASSLGATCAFLIARTLLRGWVQRRFGDLIGAIDRGIERDGNFYLFTLRMVPVFPFFVVNLAMGLTGIGVAAFYLVSQIGMLPATVIYVYAGTQLAQVRAVADVLSVELIFALSLLGLFPLVAKKALAWYSQRRRGSADATRRT